MQPEESSKTGHVLVYRSQEYVRITRDLRWVIMALVVLTFPFLPGQNIQSIFVLVPLGAIYNALFYIPKIKQQTWLVGRPSILLIDSLLIFVLLSLSSAKLSSPYTSLLLFPIISSAFWYGLRTAAGMGAAQAVLGLAIMLPQTDASTRTTVAKDYLIRIVAFVIIGIYISYLTRSDRKDRINIAEKDMQINQERQQLLALINNMADAVLVVDQSGKIGLFNDSTAKLVGSQYALVGKPAADIFKLVDENETIVDLMSIKSTTPVRRRDLKLHLQDSSVVRVEANISPYIVNQQNRGFIVILRDITREKTFEEQQEEFIAVASHELRTPLAIAEANISTSLASPSAPTDLGIRNMLNQAHSNIVFLSNIINDLTTLSKAETETLDIDTGPLEADKMVRDIQEEFINQAHAQNLELNIHIGNDLRKVSTSDFRVKQIVQNYVINSLKYTKEGSITISVENSEDEKNSLIFSVKDTGIGISVSDQKRLFTKFFRSEDYQTRQTGGSGLGLYICSKLADRLGGKVWCESKLKEGSTFYLQIPQYNRHKEVRKNTTAETENFFANV